LRFLIPTNFNRVFYYINKIKLLFDKISLIIYYGIIIILSSPDIYSFPFLLSSDGDSGIDMENSDSDSDAMDLDSDSDSGPENHEVVERENHNAPEQIMDDLDLVEKAKEGDPEALETLKENYPEFFRENNDREALD
jgi:hypothetical protein